MIDTFRHPAVGRYRGVAHPIKFGRTPGPQAFAAPALNQDGAEILTSIGAFVPRAED
jgi:crotonobetainyl-CoA:carnitine CoA-transferase CaiB-like acyl-CoA transferase